MRQVTVFVNDYMNQRRMGVGFNAADYDKVDAVWDEEDQRLVALQGIPAFQGYTKWSRCRTEHFRVLILRTMLLMSDMTDSDRADVDHPVMSTFNFLTLGLVKCIETVTGSSVELLRINRIASTEITFDYSAIMDMKFSQPPPYAEEPVEKSDNPFTIVVDNTKK